VICLLIGTAISVLIATGCSSPPPSDPNNLLVLASVGAKGNFQVDLVSGYPDNDHINNTQTWCYNVTVLTKKGDLSHWCLDLCDEPEHQVLGWSGPAERIEHTDPKWDDGAHGHIIKWDGTTLKSEESAIFCFTLEDIWESADVDWFAKNGVHWDDTGNVTGPSCILLCALPKADFNADKNKICAGNEVVFTDTSVPDDITAWNWSFPGGNPSSTDTQGPHTVTYNNTGIFSINLTITNACGLHAEIKIDYITVEDCAPVPITYNLTIFSTVGGSATATINPTTVVGPGETKIIFDIPANTVVNLTANTHTDYKFVNWTGNPIDGVADAVTTITMQDNYEIAANFKAVSATPPVIVGWETFPINKPAILLPWIALFTAVIAGTILPRLRRRRT